MFHELLNSSIVRLDSIRKYYILQSEIIDSSINKYVKKYRLGYLVDFYLSSLLDTCPSAYKSTMDFDYIGKYVKKYIDIVEVNNDTNSVKFKYKDEDLLIKEGIETNIVKCKNEIKKYIEMPNTLNDSSLMMMIVRFEEVVSKMLTKLIFRFPEAYLKDKQIKYSEVIKSDPNDLKKLFVSQEVDLVMRENLTYWFDLLRKKHGISFLHLKPYFEEFKEIYYRRNIVVHNNGKVNNEYITNVPDNFRKGVELGQILTCTKEYMNRALNLSFIMVYGMFISASKLEDDKSKFNEQLFNLGFEHLSNSDWDISEMIFGYLSKYRNQPEIDRTMSLINYWISKKNNASGYEAVKSEIESVDFSASKVDFQIAKAVLLDDYDRVNELIEQDFPVFPSSCFETWPLFIGYRKSSQYTELKQKHEEFFNTQQMDATCNDEITASPILQSDIQNIDEHTEIS